jgi:Zinc knuckle
MELGAIATGRPMGKVDNRQRQLVCWRCGKLGHKMANCKSKGLRQATN